MNLLQCTRRALIVAPHADDETIGCGGLIARLRDEGCEVFVMVATVADFHHHPGDSGPPSFVPGRRRLEELAAALRVLDATDHEVLYTDAAQHLRLDRTPRIELINRIEKDARLSLAAVRPDLLVLPAPSYNQDHEVVFRAGIAAARPHPRSAKARVGTVLTCEMPHLSWGADRFVPQLYVDISGQIQRKLEALACHHSQLRPAPDHTSLAAVETLARMRGIEAGTEYAEAYSVHRISL